MDEPTAARQSPHSNPDILIATTASALAGGCVALVGALVLAGWWFDIASFKSVYGPITMKSNAAMALLMCGSGLLAHARGFRRIGICFAAVTATLGALTLSQHLFGWNLGLDELLFLEPAGAAATASPNRMGPNAAMSLTLAGTALLLLFRGTSRAIRIAQSLAIVAVLLAMLAVAGYVYGAFELYAIARYTGIALHTALALLVLHLGILMARVDDGPMAAFVADGPAGTLLRRLVAPTILIPLLLGYLVIIGRRADLLDRGLSTAVFAVSIVVVLGTTVWQTAKKIALSDEHRRHAERDRDLLLVRERRARDEAEKASRLKDHFIAMLSHELRTPLNVMLGWTSVLESDTSRERHAHAAAVVARNGRLLARLVEDLLDISRASAGQFEIASRPMRLNAVVQASIDAMAPVAAARGVQLVGHLDPAIGVIAGDPERIQQIVSNLLSNAVKFTGDGGRVEVRTALEESMATLIVTDTGVGFDAAFAAELFQPFRQADSSTRREHGGLGLGLSIAKHIAKLHGGSIAGSSAGPAKGATFIVRLPAPVSGDSATAAGDEVPREVRT
jgi:signal transduction histidine kinase